MWSFLSLARIAARIGHYLEMPAVLLMVLVPHSGWADNSALEVNWRPAADDLEVARVTYHSAHALLTPELFFVRTRRKRYRVAAVRALDFGTKHDTVMNLSKASKAVMGINANFFDEHDQPLGLVIQRGRLQNKMHRGGKTLTGIFQVQRQTVGIVHRSDFQFGRVLEAVQAGPRLLTAGKSVSGLKATDVRSRRAGVCLDAERRLIFFASDGLAGITINEVQAILLHPAVSCVEALNLDGGGSAQLYLSGKLPGAVQGHQEVRIAGRDAIPVILGLFVKDAELASRTIAAAPANGL